ncbi:MAG: hypothetical protein ACRCU5_11010 [Rhizobiaceae bacterium]
MDWPLVITRNRDALLQIIAALFALAGLAEGRVLSTLPRPVYRAVLSVLRPAESAVRRLIIIAAHGLVVAPHIVRPLLKKIAPGTGMARVPAFCLIDPLKRFTPIVKDTSNVESLGEIIWGDETSDEHEEDMDGWQNESHARSIPRISLPGLYDPVFAAPITTLQHGLINAQQLGRRLVALKRALDNLSREARRLARWQSKRSLVLAQPSNGKPIRLTAHRPGRPPGFRFRATHEVDSVLRECHLMMFDRLNEPDTS